MFRFGHSRFQILSEIVKTGHNISFLKTTNLPLSHADANSATAIILTGKMVDMAANSEAELRYNTGFAIGMLANLVNLNGTTDDAGFKKLTLGGFPDIPQKRGLAAGVFCPWPGMEAIFEGAGDTAGNMIDHLVIKTGTGALGGGTTDLTPLSVINGAWRAAQSGDYVLANFRQNLTPVNAGEIRIRLRFCSPWKLP